VNDLPVRVAAIVRMDRRFLDEPTGRKMCLNRAIRKMREAAGEWELDEASVLNEGETTDPQGDPLIVATRFTAFAYPPGQVPA
jgi:hypothetical protein